MLSVGSVREKGKRKEPQKTKWTPNKPLDILSRTGGIDMAKAHSEKASSYCVKTDYGTFHVCYGCKLLGHCPPAKGAAGYIGHSLHDAKGCQCEHASHFDGSE